MENLSTHQATVVPLIYEPLVGADNLAVVKVFGSYTVVINKNDWANIDRAAYIVPDTIVDTTRPEFSFLAKPNKIEYRVTAKRFNKFGGIVSYGMLVPVPDNFAVGDDAWNYLGLRRWEPTIEFRGINVSGEVASAPNIYHVKYDVDSFQRWATTCFEEGDLILCTEKVHGCLQADTLITLHDNTQKPISQVSVGEQIKVFDGRNFTNSIVTNKFVQEPTDQLRWMELNFDDDSKLICTEDHQILTSRGYIEARNLLETDNIISY